MSMRKYPRTPHLPTSMSATSDDKWIAADALAYLQSGIELCVTEKMDGSNYNIVRDRAYARSIDGTNHAWDTPAKTLWSNIRWDLPENIRLSGESMYGRRSVGYENLPGPFILFAVWEDDTLLSWDDMLEWAELFNIPTVPLLYRGTDFTKAVTAWSETKDDTTSEGFVVRDAGSFQYDEYASHAAKWVRANHVRTEASWRHRDDFAVNTFV